jgi:hypothetical protein
MKIEVKDRFHCPQGVWHATCEVITLEDAKKPGPGKPSKLVRFRFAVDTDEGERLAAISFPAESAPDDELDGFVCSWMGGDMERLLNEDGEIEIARLVGKECDLYIDHGKKKSKYSYPFVIIAGIYPAGRFIKR